MVLMTVNFHWFDEEKVKSTLINSFTRSMRGIGFTFYGCILVTISAAVQNLRVAHESVQKFAKQALEYTEMVLTISWSCNLCIFAGSTIQPVNFGTGGVPTPMRLEWEGRGGVSTCHWAVQCSKIIFWYSQWITSRVLWDYMMLVCFMYQRVRFSYCKKYNEVQDCKINAAFLLFETITKLY